MYVIGGALTLLALTQASEVDAGVVWYGYPPLDFIDASRIKAPLLAHWATQDAAFPIATVDDLEKKLTAAGVSFQSERYLAQHGFANETAVGPRRIPITQYDAAWSQIAWDRTFSFFGHHLR